MEEKNKLYEDLQYIRDIINDSRNIIVEKGVGFIFWGVIVVIGLIYSYFDVLERGALRSDIAWIVLIGIGWIYTLITEGFLRKKSISSKFASRLLGTIWFGAGISMTIIGFVATASGAIEGVYVSPFISLVLGIVFLASSQIYNDKLMMAISPLWWVGAIYMFFFPGKETILVMAGMMFFLQIVPGIIFYKKYKAGQSQNGR